MSDDLEQLRNSYEEQVRMLTERVGRQARQLAVLAEVASEVHSTESVEAVFEIALKNVREKLGVSAAWIFVGDDGDERLRLAAASGVSEAYLEDIRRNGLSDCLCREVFWSGHLMQAQNTIHCPRMPDIVAGSVGSVAHACIPLVFRGGSRGVLNIAANPGATFTESELRFMETLGHQIGLGVERARRGEAERQRHEEARNAYRELQAAQDRIIEAEKLALIGTFAAGLAHEIRNPLNSIALQLSLIERRIDRHEADAKIRELTGVIREEVSRLDELAGDFLQFSRTDRMQQALADLDGVIEYVLRLLEPQSASADVRLVYERVAALPPIPLDADKMKQVLINLIRNGIQAAPSGGQVTVRVEEREGSAILSVEDTGPGLPEDIDIFQLFVTTKPGGTGLGLSIARQIVIQHGGAIGARNAPGKGAVFEITLPLAPPEPQS